MKFKLLLIVLLLNSIPAFSQILPKTELFVRCLSLQMTGKKKNVYFFEGDNIVVKTISDHKKQNFQILRMTDSSFYYGTIKNLAQPTSPQPLSLMRGALSQSKALPFKGKGWDGVSCQIVDISVLLFTLQRNQHHF